MGWVSIQKPGAAEHAGRQTGMSAPPIELNPQTQTPIALTNSGVVQAFLPARAVAEKGCPAAGFPGMVTVRGLRLTHVCVILLVGFQLIQGGAACHEKVPGVRSPCNGVQFGRSCLCSRGRSNRLPVPLLFHYVFKNYTFKCGKILDWALSEENEDLYTSLLSHASHSMKMGGLERCQIAYVNDEQSQIKTFLGQYGFRRVHTIKLLQKRLR